MSPERYHQLNALADAALAIEPERRAAFLDEACSGDDELRKHIDAILQAEFGPATFLDQPLIDEVALKTIVAPPQRHLEGKRIQNYEVISRLGAGGIGEVWLARDSNLGREVALKLLSPRFAADPYHLRRLQQEARSLSSLNHPNIVTVYEIGQTQNELFIAEERVLGENIRQHLARGPIEVRLTLDIAAQCAAALGAAHAAGLVHRDIKPENVILRPDGLVKVLDFGLARIVQESTPERSSVDSCSIPGLILGTVRYMSPEQARGLPVDGRSDIFSLGVMLYEMASGFPPFSGSTPTDTLVAILTSEPEPLSRRARELPAPFADIVQRCLAKDPGARYGSAEELRQDLKDLIERLDRPAVSRKRSTVVLAIACLAVAVVGGVFLSTHPKRAESPFSSMQITRIATRGEPLNAATSLDGKLIAYVLREDSGQSVWIKNGADEVTVVPAEAAEYSGLVISRDNAFLYYRRRIAGTTGELYRVALNGGSPQRLIEDVSGDPALSPDGRQLAFVRLKPSTSETSIMVSNADGSGAFPLATVRRPKYFDEHSVAWSPDGAYLACFTGEAARYSKAVSKLVELKVRGGDQRVLTKKEWVWPRAIAWSPAGNFLAVAAATRGSEGYQVWTVSNGGNTVTRLTNDLTNYNGVSFADAGSKLVTVQAETSARLWTSRPREVSRAIRIGPVALHSRNVSVAWTPDERIVYSDPSTDNGNIWSLDAEGRNPRRLTSGNDYKEQIAVTPDGRYLVYKREGNIWRVDANGAHEVQLTHGPLDVHPDIAPDSRSVVFASFQDWAPGIGGEPTLWRAPIDGGDAVEVSREPASYPKVSGDATQVACIHFPGRDPRFSAHRLAILALNGSESFRSFEVSPLDGAPLAWAPVGNAVDYVDTKSGAGNIWRQRSDGGPPIQITDFASDDIYSFAWSRNGRLACVRGTTTRSVVALAIAQ